MIILVINLLLKILTQVNVAPPSDQQANSRVRNLSKTAVFDIRRLLFT